MIGYIDVTVAVKKICSKYSVVKEKRMWRTLPSINPYDV